MPENKNALQCDTDKYPLDRQQWDHPLSSERQMLTTRCKGAVSKLNLMCAPVFEIHKYVK